MRILASNPDTIGDMVLRQPLYRALLNAGHELTLIVRPSVAPMAAMIAPEATLLVLPAEVYAPLDDNWSAFEPIVYDARDWTPDLLLIAPYQWTEFEERLAEDLRGVPGLRVVGMSGRLYAGDPFRGASPTSSLKFDRTLTVDEDVPEADKNALLADMLSAPVTSVNPVLSPDEDALADARGILAERGLSPGDFWIACVTGTANVPIKAWPAQRWAEVLTAWHERYGRRFLFVGLPAERTVVDQVIAGMGDAGHGSAVWMEDGSSVTTLAALASLSQGYAGHDTGPMHIAAATGKLVLAIFGGGHKLRFLPRVTPSVVLSVRVPCAGCGWACSFERAHCVDALRPIDVLRAVDDLEAGRILGQDIRLLPLPIDVHDQMTAFAADLARDRLRTLSVLQRQIEAIDPTAVPRLTEALAVQTKHAESLSKQLTESAAEMSRLHGANESLRSEATGLHQQLADREQAVSELRQAVMDADQRTRVEADARKAEVEPLRKEVESLKLRLAAMEPKHIGRPRKSWRERAVDLVCGKRHYEPSRLPPPMPKIRIVLRVLQVDADANVRRTVDSVLAEQYPHLEFVLAVEDARSTGFQPVASEHNESQKESQAGSLCYGRAALEPYADRVTKIIPLGDKPFAGIAEAFAGTDADLVAWLYVGQAYEPGALFRIGEYFRDHSLAMAAAFEQTSGVGRRRHVGRPSLAVPVLRRHDLPRGDHIVFRREACTLLGPLNPDKGAAAGWDLAIRFSRRFGIRQGQGHSVCNFDYIHPWPAASAADDFAVAQRGFEASFGTLGRLRTIVLHDLAATRSVLPTRGGRTIGQDWVSVDAAERTDTDPDAPDAGNSRNGAVEASARDPLAPAIVPVALRRPDRLLFSGSDVAAGDRTLHRIYYERSAGIAVTLPDIDPDERAELLEKRSALARTAVRPAENEASAAYRHFAGGSLLARVVASLPTPYWRLSRSRPGAESNAGRLLSLVGQVVALDSKVRALVVGCYDGVDLDDLKSRTRWALTGLETNPDAAAIAEGKGIAFSAAAPRTPS